MANFYPTNDADFAVWLGNFITIANVNLIPLGLTAADITALTALKTDLDAKVAAANAARATAVSATAALKASRKNANIQASFRGKAITANPNVANSIKEQLGLNVRDTILTPIIPLVPAGVVAQAFANGTHVVSWSANGNKGGTQYLVEAKFGNATAFTFVNVTTKTKLEHTGQTPGVRVVYRVKARRGDNESGYSGEAIVYG